MDVERIPLANTVFEGHNNAYLLSGDETVLVDAGVATDRTREQFREGLAARGATFADVDRVFLTHWHQDHGGLAGEIQDAGGATVHVHPADAPLVAVEPAARADLDDRHRRAFDDWGLPEDARAELREHLDGTGLQVPVDDPAPVRHGDTFAVDGANLEVIHAPGHAAGQVCYAFEDDDGPQAFTGDAVLPEYTPNVGGADVRVDRPLSVYLDTLDRLADRGFVRLWPGHRAPIDDPAGRIATIRRHHEERAHDVLAALRDDGPADAWTVSARLFGGLSGIHILHGPGEAFAHLDHLERAGAVRRDDDGVYRLPDGTRECLAGREDGRWPLRAR